MRIKLSLRGRGATDLDLVVTADATATVGDVAAALAGAGPSAPGGLVDPSTVTLRLLDPSSGRVLSVAAPSSLVTETALRSGALVDIARAEESTGLGQGKAAELRVIAGPDRGMTVSLPFGSTRVGRAGSCEVRLSDPLVSKSHLRITVGSFVEVHDLNSANGVIVGDQRVQRLRVGSGDTILVGDSTLQIVQVRVPERAQSDSTDIAFIRPPQVRERVRVRTFQVPQAPELMNRGRFPMLAMLAPLIMGGIMFAFTHQLISVVFVALSPILMIGNWIEQRHQVRTARKQSTQAFQAALVTLRANLEEHRRAESLSRHALHPSVDLLVAGALRRDGILWSRRPEDPEFLTIRLGLGSDTAAVDFESPMAGSGRGIPELEKDAQELCDSFLTIDDIPIVADLRVSGGLGLCGSREALQELGCATVGQIATLYSPAEVVLACLTSGLHMRGWQWLEWLPHTSSPHSPLAASHLAADPASATELLAALEGLLEDRRSHGRSELSAEGSGPRPRGPQTDEDEAEGSSVAAAVPAVLVVVDDPLVDRARLNRVAELGPDYGIHCLWVSEDFASLPAACRTFVSLEGRTGAVGEVRRGRTVQPVVLDLLSVAEAGRLARSLSPVFDAGVPVDDDSDLPGAVSFIQMTGHELADSREAALERWRQSGTVIDRSAEYEPIPGPAVSLAALVGQGATSPVALDLRAQGPHALVGGTTGAGKSEFLQAWVLGMAQAVSPDRLTFLFVDYKGGSAFARCTDLPHTVGLVTDLSPFLVRRALASLRAEIRYREELLNAKNAKDQVTLERRGDPDCPPSLVIIIDEFAALAGEVPEFVDGVVDVAQRGRSLGLHLIMATQRPAGVIKDNLRANTNLRVALRMADVDDSRDVLGDGMAAHFPQETPGRGAAKTGPGRVAVFQSAYPGARTTEEVQAVSVAVEEMGFGVARQWQVPESPRPGVDVAQDIDRVVDTLCAAADLAAIQVPRRPWLPELAQTYNIRNLRQRSDSELVLGVIDQPDRQAQEAEYFYPDREGNIAYYGASGSGKTTALRSLAIAAAITPRGGPVDIYGLDFAGGGLEMLRPMPHVGDIVPGDDEERVTRLMDMLAGVVEERAARYSAAHASDLGAYRRISGKADEPRVLLLVDGIGVFSSDYQTVTARMSTWQRFQQILLDGRAVGVHVAVTADRQAAVPSSVASNFQRRVVLRQADEDAYLMFGLPKDVLSPSSTPGRAMQAGRPELLQLAILGDNINTLAQARLIEQLGGYMESQGRVRPRPIVSLPAVVPASKVPLTIDRRPVIGIDSGSLLPLPFRPVGTFTVGGGPQTGRTNALEWLARSLRGAFPQAAMFHIAPGRSVLASKIPWRMTARGADEAASLLSSAKPFLESLAREGEPAAIVVVEGIADFVYSAADAGLMETISLARSNGHLVIAESDLAGWSRGGALASALRSGRAGLVLCPALGDGDTVVGVSVPALPGRSAVPGRGYFTQSGGVWKVQVPLI